MTLFEGMCIGFLAGVVATIFCVLVGAMIDEHIDNNDCGGSDLPVGGRDRGCHNGQDNNQGGGER